MQLTLDELPGIKSKQVRTDDKWCDYDFEALAKELSRLIDRNPVRPDPKPNPKKEQLLHFGQRDSKTKACGYVTQKIMTECEKGRETQDLRKILSEKKLCFNCTGTQHRASECKSAIMQKCYHAKHQHAKDISKKVSNVPESTPYMNLLQIRKYDACNRKFSYPR